ncbi:17646_t:CDS:1, partial [Racocetra persica]
ETWADIPADMIINSFKKCGIPHGIETELEEQMVISVDDEENYLIVYIKNPFEY